MDASTIVIVVIGVMNAGLFLGVLGAILLFVRKPPSKKPETKTLKKCPTCERWQEVK